MWGKLKMKSTLADKNRLRCKLVNTFLMRHNKWQALGPRRRATGNGQRAAASYEQTSDRDRDRVGQGRGRERGGKRETLTHFRPLFALFARLLLKCFAVAYINQSGKTKRLPQAAQQQQQHWQRQREWQRQVQTLAGRT